MNTRKIGKNEHVKASIDKQEQYSRRNYLLLHDIPENKNEKTDDLRIAMVNEHLELSINEADIERTHRIRKPRDVKNRDLSLLNSSDIKIERTYLAEQNLKGKNIAVTESLIATRMKKLKKAREIYDFKNVWTSDGRIFRSSRPEVFLRRGVLKICNKFTGEHPGTSGRLLLNFM